VWFESLVEAQRDSDGAVILEGDDGGQIYVAFPARAGKCMATVLDQLLRDLDAICCPETMKTWPDSYSSVAP
jgi:hypothetical protein